MPHQKSIGARFLLKLYQIAVRPTRADLGQNRRSRSVVARVFNPNGPDGRVHGDLEPEEWKCVHSVEQVFFPDSACFAMELFP